jgi:hypothetical protein
MELINSLEIKWDPRFMQPEGYKKPDDPETSRIDPRVTTGGTLADAFRIFTDGYANDTTEAPDINFSNDPAPEIAVYTDGSALDNETDNVRAGAGVFFGEGDRNLATRVPKMLGPSNQVGEILAIKEAVEAAPLDAPLKIFSDSKYAIAGLTKNMHK